MFDQVLESGQDQEFSASLIDVKQYLIITSTIIWTYTNVYVCVIPNNIHISNAYIAFDETTKIGNFWLFIEIIVILFY